MGLGSRLLVQIHSPRLSKSSIRRVICPPFLHVHTGRFHSQFIPGMTRSTRSWRLQRTDQRSRRRAVAFIYLSRSNRDIVSGSAAWARIVVWLAPTLTRNHWGLEDTINAMVEPSKRWGQNQTKHRWARNDSWNSPTQGTTESAAYLLGRSLCMRIGWMESWLRLEGWLGGSPVGMRSEGEQKW